MSGIDQKRRDLGKVLDELKAVQEKMRAGELSQTEGEAAEAKAKEAETLQNDIDKYDRLERLQTKGREVTDPALPHAGKAKPEADEAKAADDAHTLGGYCSLGELFVASKAFQDHKERGFPTGVVSNAFAAGRVDLRTGRVALTKAEVAVLERKAIPTLGTGVIDPQRDADIVRATELDKLTLLDVIPTIPTTSNAIEYIRVDTYTRAADIVADGELKPEAAAVVSLVNKPVRTFANWIPVTEQMLSDAPAIIAEVNDHLLWDVRNSVEEQLLYGGGTGSDFSGFFVDSGIAAAREETGDELIDVIRRMVTDVAVSNYMADTVLLHPYEWETVVLTKGSDNHYVWVIVTTESGSRLWGLRVVECNNCQETDTVVSPERNVLVGDFRRGAQLRVREGVQLAVGWNEDDFTRNKRTIRAEMRAAFALKRPGAFRKFTAKSASAS